MKLLLLGASGRTGQLVLKQGLDLGYYMTVLVRDPSKIAINSRLVKVIKGTPANADDVRAAMIEAEAVISTLNNARKSDMPWDKPVSPPRLMETAISNTVVAMRDFGVRRIVVLSAAGAGDSFQHSGAVMRWMIRNTNLKQVYADHDQVDALLRAQFDMDWTLIRPVALNNADAIKAARILSYENQPKPTGSISRKHVARILLDALHDPSLIRMAPVVSEG